MVKLYRPDGTVHIPTQPSIAKPPYPPFDRTRGEKIGELGEDYVIVEPSKWADTPVLDLAWEQTRQALKGYRLASIEAEVLIQEYHARDELAVVFALWGKAAGKATWQWHYVPTVIEIKGETKALMVLAGRWKAGTRH